MLAKPVDGEPLYFYVIVSQAGISGVLVREDIWEIKSQYSISAKLSKTQKLDNQLSKNWHWQW